MKRTALLAVAAAILSPLTTVAGAAPAAAAGGTCDGVWRVEPLPAAIRRLAPAGLSSVAATGDGQLWAIAGFIQDVEEQSLLLHRSPAGRWNVEVLPPLRGHRLLRVVARQDDVWVLTYRMADFTQKLLHRDAGGTWRVVSFPKSAVQVNDVTLDRPGDVWAINASRPPSVFHWAAGTWQRLELPVSSLDIAQAYRLDGTAPNDVWVVGEDAEPASYAKLVSWHWDGTSWQREYPDGPSYESGEVLAQRHGVAYLPLPGSHAVLAHRAGTWQQLGQQTPPTSFLTAVELLGKNAAPVVFGALEGAFYAAYVARLSPSGIWVQQPILGPSGHPNAVSGRFEQADGDGRGNVWAVGWLADRAPLVIHAC